MAIPSSSLLRALRAEYGAYQSTAAPLQSDVIQEMYEHLPCASQRAISVFLIGSYLMHSAVERVLRFPPGRVSFVKRASGHRQA